MSDPAGPVGGTTVVSALRAELGDAVVTTPGRLDAARADKSGHRSPSAPLAIVEARSIEDVQTTMRIATATRTPVVTRGAGTGLAGAAMAAAGEIVLSTLAMDRVLEIDEDDLLAVVQPGILNGAFNDLLAERGLWFAPDPASRAISTIGGNIATGAGGLLCAKYGVTRDAVLGLTVVLADGRVIRTGHRSVKGVTGLDLTALMVGSEGLLGVVVEAMVRIRRRVEGTIATVACFFPDAASAARASSAITAAGVQPAVMELMDAASLRAVDAVLGTTMGEAGAAHLVVQTDGPAAVAEAEAALAIVRSLGGTAELTTDIAEGERLLTVRRTMHPAMERLGTTLIEDVSVPRSALPAMFAAIAEVEERFGVTIPRSPMPETGTSTRTSSSRARRYRRTCGRRPTRCSRRRSRSAAPSRVSTGSACSSAGGSRMSSALIRSSCSAGSRRCSIPSGSSIPERSSTRSSSADPSAPDVLG